MKYALTALVSVLLLSFVIKKDKLSIHQFKIKSIDGKTIDLARFKGKKILVVNTASACGYTPQYTGLQKLSTDYKDILVVIGFPCNQFGAQESGSESEIKEFCKAKFGVTFPLSSKIDVKGENISPVYKWLCNKSENGVLDAEIKWNFNKFLLDENGKMIAYFPSKIIPNSDEIIKYLK